MTTPKDDQTTEVDSSGSVPEIDEKIFDIITGGDSSGEKEGRRSFEKKPRGQGSPGGDSPRG